MRRRLLIFCPNSALDRRDCFIVYSPTSSRYFPFVGPHLILSSVGSVVYSGPSISAKVSLNLWLRTLDSGRTRGGLYIGCCY